MSPTLSTALVATIRYEALLAMRHRVVWLSLLPLCALIVLLGDIPRGSYRDNEIASIGEAALLINFLGSIGIAIVLADRMAAQRRPGLREVFGSTPTGTGIRVAGIIAGPWLVASATLGAVLVIMGMWLTITAHSGRPLVAAVCAFVVIVLPGSLLLTMIANVLGLLMPVAAARALIVPLWYWATLLSPLVPVPSPARSVLSPSGDYPAAAWLSVPPPGGAEGPLHPEASTATATMALGGTVAAAALVFLIGHMLLAKRH
jgi:ABC-2 type transport system permease protein